MVPFTSFTFSEYNNLDVYYQILYGSEEEQSLTLYSSEEDMNTGNVREGILLARHASPVARRLSRI